MSARENWLFYGQRWSMSSNVLP